MLVPTSLPSIINAKLNYTSVSVLQNDANCDCYQTGDGYAKDARLNCPSSLVVSPDGTLYVADLGNIRIRAIRRNQPPTGMS